MRIFIAGATGAIGKRLVPLLVSAGHQVIGTTRTAAKTAGLRAQGAEPMTMDGLNKESVVKAVVSSRPDAVVHQMTALASMRDLKHFDQEFAITNRLRTEGTEYLLEGARSAGSRIFVAQSYAGWPSLREGGRMKTEEDPLDQNPPEQMKNTLAAIRKLESMVVTASGIAGIVLRYGSLYGPGTTISEDGDMVQMVRQGKLPVIGNGAGVWSFLHVEDAARATKLAIERGQPGIYNIVDDDPEEVSVWLPELASTIGAKEPHHLPAWLGRLAVGEVGVSVMTEVRGASNAKAKRELGWQPMYASWREGFRHGLSDKVVSGALE
jgi:nucleoside-diphosphate-sugar epimerase